MMQHKRRRFLRLISLSITAVILISVLIASACAEPNAETIAPETQTASVEQPTAQAAEPAPAPSTEAPAVPLTEAPTVPSTEPATEPPTEPPTEPETEAPTAEPASDDPETPRGMFRFAPDGTLTLIDDFEYLGMDADGNTMSKQFITVQSRDGSYFYIIIDRTGESENVYFLNQVDLADLKTLAGNGVQQIPDSSCTCKTHCSVGHIDLTCPICSANMTECAADSTKEGQTPSSDEDSEPGEKTAEQNTPESNAKKQKQQSAVLVLFVALIAVGVFYFWKRKKKGGKSSKKKASPEFEFDDEDEDDDELEVEFTPQEKEPGRTERLKPVESPVAPAGEADAEEENDFEDEGGWI